MRAKSCDVMWQQEETSFSVVEHQYQQPSRQRRIDESPDKKSSGRLHQHGVRSRASAGTRFAASVVSRYRSLSSFFARSSSVIGPVADDALPTRVAYRMDANKHHHQQQYGVNDRRTVSVTCGQTAALNDAFDVEWFVTAHLHTFHTISHTISSAFYEARF